MAKEKTTFYCTECGNETEKWNGQCPFCNSWNTLKEARFSSAKAKPNVAILSREKVKQPQLIHEISLDETPRISIPDQELNQVLGGGIVPGSVVLVGGEPGIGKSTLMLQLALKMKDTKVLYVSGEESEQQVTLRAKRLGIENASCYLLGEVNCEKIVDHCKEMQPDLLVLDSIQTLYTPQVESAPGTVSQIRTCASIVTRLAKEYQIPVFLIGHITKEGSIAGPKILEHIVDTVLVFEGDRNHFYRILRANKNRFGTTQEIGIYQMNQGGLEEVPNPSELFLSQKEEHLSGSSIGVTLEGVRPILIETQALVSTAVFGTPQRSTTGFDNKRLHMLLAVLEKRCGLALGMQDVFLNLVGGIKVKDPALDLAVAASLVSSFQDFPISEDVCLCGEVGLSGEVRSVTRIEQRITEAERLGFKEILVPKFNAKGVDTSKMQIRVVQISKVTDMFTHLFG